MVSSNSINSQWLPGLNYPLLLRRKIIKYLLSNKENLEGKRKFGDTNWKMLEIY